jgi:hypothetical protein
MASFVQIFMEHSDERVRRHAKTRRNNKTMPAPAPQSEPIPERPVERKPEPAPQAVPEIVRTAEPLIPAIPRQIDLDRARSIRARSAAES